MSEIMVYVTAPDMPEAKRIAESLVGERLAACVNLIPGMRSMYWWNGKVESSEEVVCLFKTTLDKFHALSEKIGKLHSYETPCVVALPIVAGSDDFLEWIRESTRA